MEILDEARAQALALGIGHSQTSVEHALKSMVLNSAPVTHEQGNRRYKQYVFRVANGEILAVHKFEADPMARGRPGCPTCDGLGWVAVRNQCAPCYGEGCRICDWEGDTEGRIKCPDCVMELSIKNFFNWFGPRAEAPPAYRSIPVNFANVPGTVYGGAFRGLPAPGPNRFVVCMAAELGGLPADFYVLTKDFQTPPEEQLKIALALSIQAIKDGKDVYVGCMGGIGRTGTFMAALAKVMYGARGIKCEPVEYVRHWYNEHAVETAGQQKFVDELNVDALVAWVDNKR